MTDHVSSARAASRRRRYAALIAAGVLLPLPVLAGCSDDGSAEAIAASQDIAPASRPNVKDGGTVRWAVDGMPGTLNAFQTDADATTTRITGAVLPALFTIDDRGTPQRSADYLDAADVSAREPKQVVTYKLNAKARWSDGRAIGAADFIAQWQALRGKDNAFWTARNAGYDRIDKVQQGANAHEVKVTFGKPYADWQSLFTPLYPKSVMSDANAFNDGAREQLKVGAGPFTIQKRDADSGRIVLARNTKWWGAPAKLDRIVLEVLPRDKRAAALTSGTIDVAEVDQVAAKKVSSARAKPNKSKGKDSGNAGPQAGSPAAGAPAADGAEARKAEKMSPRKAAEVASLRGYAVRKALEPAYTQLALNGSSGPLADERVRRGVARAIDRQALADTVLKPLGLPSRPLGSHLVMAGQKGYADQSDALGDQDTGAAKSLLADAGWKAGDGVEEAATPRPAGKKSAAASKSAAPGKSPSADASDNRLVDGSDGRNPQRPGAEGHGSRVKANSHEAGARPAAAEAPLSFAGAVGSEVQQAALLRQSASFYKAAAADQKETADGDTDSAAYDKFRRYKKRAARALGAAEAIETGQAHHLPGSGGRAGAPHPDAKPGDASDGDKAAGEAKAGKPEADKADKADKAAAARVPLLKKDGKPLALRFVLPDGAGSEQLRAVGDRIAAMLGKIGVQTSVQKVADKSYFQDHIASGDYDLALYSWPGTAFPATDARPIYAKPQPAPDGSLTVEQNYTRVGTDHIDQLFEQATSELDGDAAHTLVEQADARIWAAAGSIPLYQRPELVAAKKSLANVGAFGFGSPRFQDIGYKK
ncbi:ABC transporter family substrate-binding protein [Streptomyces sp. NPDC091266]|uniref:ABC transporter family substrate-binding protein n=1 Tax=Streptomyces sp. NPDC091266 TaxID=3365978 RepID=UPI00380FAF2C